MIQGTLVDWSDEESLLHVHWICLDCDREFYTDVELDTKSPQVWGCEYNCKNKYFCILF